MITAVFFKLWPIEDMQPLSVRYGLGRAFFYFVWLSLSSLLILHCCFLIPSTSVLLDMWDRRFSQGCIGWLELVFTWLEEATLILLASPHQASFVVLLPSLFNVALCTCQLAASYFRIAAE